MFEQGQRCGPLAVRDLTKQHDMGARNPESSGSGRGAPRSAQRGSRKPALLIRKPADALVAFRSVCGVLRTARPLLRPRPLPRSRFTVSCVEGA